MSNSDQQDNQTRIVRLNLDQAQAAQALAECLQLLRDLQFNQLSHQERSRLALQLRLRIAFAILQLEPHVSSAEARAFAEADLPRATSLLRSLAQLPASGLLQG